MYLWICTSINTHTHTHTHSCVVDKLNWPWDFLRLSVHADMSEGTNLKPLLVNLWNLAQKHGALDYDLLVRSSIRVSLNMFTFCMC